MFSQATITEGISLILEKGWSHSQITTFFLKYGLNKIAPVSIGSKRTRINEVIIYLNNNQKLSGIYSDNLHLEILNELIEDCISEDWEGKLIFSEEIIDLKRLLLIDGFIITEDKEIMKMLDEEYEETVEQKNLLEDLLDKYNFITAKGHYKQAIDNYTRGKWAACNAQLRSFMEELFLSIATELYSITYNRSYEARKDLSKKDPIIFQSTLNEWDDNGTGFFNGLWKRLCPEGSHPGLSSEFDSKFRFNIVLYSSVEILRRFDEEKG